MRRAWPGALAALAAALATRALPDLFGPQAQIEPLPGPGVVFGGDPIDLPPCKSPFEVLLSLPFNLTRARAMVRGRRESAP